MGLMSSDFLWGVATSAYQIEGSVGEGGRGESIWDRFAETSGRIADGSSGRYAADHYARVSEDVALMRDLGVDAYRFSVAWPRIVPRGRGGPNAAGLDFYDRLVDLLLERGIRPFATLYHWDLPQAIQDWGGWVARDTVDRFAEYVDVVTYRLGDRVQDWITLHEPEVIARRGHVTGEHAPGLTDATLYSRVAHHLLLAHAEALPVIRNNGRGVPARVGIALNLSPVEAFSDHDEDQRAAQIRDGTLNRWFLDALFHASYPRDILERQPIDVERFEMDRIAAPIDFLGVNYSSRQIVRMGVGDEPVTVRPGGVECTAAGVEVYPRGLYDLLLRIKQDYDPPALYVTECGAAFDDSVGPAGAVHDTRRAAFLEDHVEQAGAAASVGVPLRGYFVRSLLDGWEWTHGYTRRYGLVYVDGATRARTIKESGRWYARWIAGEGRER